MAKFTFCVICFFKTFVTIDSLQSIKCSLPSIDEFVTLSPIPGFKAWAESQIRESLNGESIEFVSTPHVTGNVCQKGLHNELKELLLVLLEVDFSANTILTAIETIIESNNGSNETLVAVERLLSELACQYLLQEKDERLPLCRVARFHVGNGAEVYRINKQADLSKKGRKQSYGFMVNYRYDPKHMKENRGRFRSDLCIPTSHIITDRARN